MAAEVLSAPQPAHLFSYNQHERSAPLQRTNYGSHIDPKMVSWLTPTSKETPLSEIRARYMRDGYVWIKNVIPRSDVYDIREQYFRTISSTGLLAPDSSPRDGIFNSNLDPTAHQGLGATPQKSAEKTLDEIHASNEYQSFITHPNLREWVRRLMGWDKEILLKRGLIRHNVPGSKCPSGIHYDQLFLRAGDPVFVTAWVPMGDCAANGGGLMYLEDSCKLAEHIENRFKEQQEKENMDKEERISAFNYHMGELGHLSHNAETWAKEDGLGKRWLVADFEAGDVVFHSPWMIHASSQNSDKFGRIRLASDLRFYEEGAKIDESSMRNIFSDIYKDHYWGDTVPSTPIFSGPGSHNPANFEPYVSAVRQFIMNTFSTPPNVVDLGCGDFFIGRQIRNLTNRYIACDIVSDVIDYDRHTYAGENVDFRVLDMISESLPAGDLVFVRQVLQHLTNDQISRFLPKLNRYKWAIVTEEPSSTSIHTKLKSASGLRSEAELFNFRSSNKRAELSSTAFSLLRDLIILQMDDGELWGIVDSAAGWTRFLDDR
ncbi:MAG: hypothetical protein Q9227_006655 [Pyrenula ochraceoflavens]